MCAPPCSPWPGKLFQLISLPKHLISSPKLLIVENEGWRWCTLRKMEERLKNDMKDVHNILYTQMLWWWYQILVPWKILQLYWYSWLVDSKKRKWVGCCAQRDPDQFICWRFLHWVIGDLWWLIAVWNSSTSVGVIVCK